MRIRHSMQKYKNKSFIVYHIPQKKDLPVPNVNILFFCLLTQRKVHENSFFLNFFVEDTGKGIS